MQTISKAKLKQYQQLHSKKFRQKYGLFIVEGIKSVHEVDQSDWTVACILCTSEFKDQNKLEWQHELSVIDDVEFAKTSRLKNPQEVLAIVEMNAPKPTKSSWELALSGINDPGNLGTILRTADWFGITQVYCSHDCVDVYNPKTIQSSMGSFLRVRIDEVDLSTELASKNVYATLLEGKNVNDISSDGGVILIGSEANGIDHELLEQIDYTAVTIPKLGSAESLNAGVAAAICIERLINSSK